MCPHEGPGKPAVGSLVLAKTAGDQGFQGRDDALGVLADGVDRDVGAACGGERHQAHDRGAAHALAAAQDAHVGLELLHRLDEFCRGARVQPLLVDDAQDAHDGARPRWRVGKFLTETARFSHFPASTRLAIVMYLRPDSCAAATASGRGHSPRTLASLTSIGRLIPARTSTFGLLITEMARFDGVPPNMSVRIATPSPLSTRLTASMMFLRHCSPLSSGPMVIASIWDCGPTTCSRAARNSTASRPWVTITRPIIGSPRGRQKACATRKGHIHDHPPHDAQGPRRISSPYAALRQ